MGEVQPDHQIEKGADMSFREQKARDLANRAIAAGDSPPSPDVMLLAGITVELAAIADQMERANAGRIGPQVDFYEGVKP